MLPILILQTLGFAAPAFTITDNVDAQYAANTRRSEEASDWYLEQMAAEPDASRWLVSYVGTLARLPNRRTVQLPELVQTWRAQHAGDGAAAEAIALGLSAMSPNMYSSSPYVDLDAETCDRAIRVLSEDCDDENERYHRLYHLATLPNECGVDQDTVIETLTALARNGDVGEALRVGYSHKDGIDDDDLQALRNLLDESPWRVGGFGSYFTDAPTGKVEQAQKLLLDRAIIVAASNRASRVSQAIRLFHAAEEKDHLIQAYERLIELDPEHPTAKQQLERARQVTPDTQAESNPTATTFLDPVTRLNALKAAPPNGDSAWKRKTYWMARAEAAKGANDVEEQFLALSKWMAITASSEPNFAFIRLAIAHDTHLRAAKKAAAQAVYNMSRPLPVQLDGGGAAWRERYADALAVQAELFVYTQDDQAAILNLEKSVALSPATPDRLLLLARLYAKHRDPTVSRPLLTAAIARSTHLDDVEREEAVQDLIQVLERQPLWGSDDPQAWIEAMVRHDENNATVKDRSPTLDGSVFDDFEVIIDGKPTRLLDIEGPLVVDLWATWCGPCKESLPHLDMLTREFEGQITFVAVSVDKLQTTSDRYLAQRGGARFVSAFAGASGMNDLNVSGIPAMFVFDADHALVARLTGWGGPHLDNAIDAMLADQP